MIRIEVIKSIYLLEIYTVRSSGFRQRSSHVLTYSKLLSLQLFYSCQMSLILCVIFNFFNENFCSIFEFLFQTQKTKQQFHSGRWH